MTKQEWQTRRAILREIFLRLEAKTQERSTADGIMALGSAFEAVVACTDAKHDKLGFAWDDLREHDQAVAGAWARWLSTRSLARIGWAGTTNPSAKPHP